GQRDRDRGESPRGEELADDGLPRLDRQRHQELDAAGLTLLGPEPHAERRHEEQEQPRMEREERREIRLVTLVEPAEIGRERVRHDEEDRDEHVGDGRREVARELPLEHRRNPFHALAPPVIVRNTSSRRPVSSWSSSSFQPCRSASRPIGISGSRPSAGKAVSRPLEVSTSVSATSGRAPISARTVSRSDASASLSETALWNRERAASPAGVSSARILPPEITTARVQIASTSSSRCVEITIVLDFAMPPISWRTSCFWFGSRPSVGSSSSSTSGSCRIACARPTRRR